MCRTRRWQALVATSQAGDGQDQQDDRGHQQHQLVGRVAEVLTFRVEQHQVPTQKSAGRAGPPRTPTAADLAAVSYPTPLEAARPASRPKPQDLTVLGAALELGREANTERQTADASADTADDVSTPHVDERRDGLSEAGAHLGHAGAAQARSNALLDQDGASRASETAGAPASATAAQSYPTPIKEVTTAQTAPKGTPTAPAARTAARQPLIAGRRR